jgi:uncharacterized protein (TIGR03118 family)
MRKMLVFLVCVLCAQVLLPPASQAQTNSYKQTNLVSGTQGLAPNIDQNLVNPWGICIIPGDPFWISDNNSPTGVTSLHTKTGALQGVFTVAPPKGSSNPATATGCVGNSLGGFALGGSSSLIIFDTEDGTISGWTGGASTVLAVDNSANPTAATGAVYKGLALLTNSQGTFLLATNFRSGTVEVYDTNFHLTNFSGTFTDPNPPAVPTGSGSPGYAPFGIHAVTVNNTPMVVVAYALQDAAKHDPMIIASSGFVDLYDQNGNLVRRITSDSHLNSPWGAVIPPSTFGAFAGDLLVGNFGDGTINAFNFTSGAFIDQMKDSTGAVIVNGSLWDMIFDPSGKTGDPNTMYVTAGLNSEMHGLFTAITPNATQPAPTPDFSLSASPTSQTISAGQNAQFTITLGRLNGFNSAVSLTCSGQPLGSTCTFAQSSLTPASGGNVTTTMTIMTSSNPYMATAVVTKNSGSRLYALLIPALALLAIFIVRRASRTQNSTRRMTFQYLAASLGIAIVTTCLLVGGGCGNYNSNSTANGTQRGMTTVMITATSGSLSHSTSVSLTVQ